MITYSQLLSCAEGLKAAELSGEAGCGWGKQHYVVSVECCPYCDICNDDSIFRVCGGAHMLYHPVEKEPEKEWAKRAALPHPAGGVERDCVSCHSAARIYIHAAHLFYKHGIYIVVV